MHSCRFKFIFSVLDIPKLAVVQYFTKGLMKMIDLLVETVWLLNFLTSFLHTYTRVEFYGPVYFVS